MPAKTPKQNRLMALCMSPKGKKKVKPPKVETVKKR